MVARVEIVRTVVDVEADRRSADVIRRLEAEAVAGLNRRRHFDDQLAALLSHDRAEVDAAVVGLRARDVVAPDAAAVHAAGESATEDLHERLDFAARSAA